MTYYVPFYIVCSRCGHNNQPHPVPNIGIRMVLEGWAIPCRSCGKQLNPVLSTRRPLVRKILAQLQQEGKTPACEIIVHEGKTKS